MSELSSETALRHKYGAHVLLLCILLMAAALRLHHLAAQSLWLDELWAVEVLTGHGSGHLDLPFNQIITPPNLTHWDNATSMGSVWNGMGGITGPPLYPMIQRLWSMMAGTDDVALRLLSVICSLTAILLLFPVARQSFGTTSALWACSLMATAGPQIQYAQEARPYAMMLILGLAAILLVQRIQVTGLTPMRAVGLTLMLSALLLIHYFSVGALAAIFIFAIVRTRGKIRIGIGGCVIVAGLFFAALWGPSMIRQIPKFAVTDNATLFLHETGAGHVWSTWLRLVRLPMALLSERPLNRSAILGGMFFYAMAVMLSIPRAGTSSEKTDRVQTESRQNGLIWLLWFVCIVGVLVVLDFTRSTMHLNFIRYPLLASPAVYVLFGGVRPSLFPRLIRSAIPLAALSLCLLTVGYSDIQKSEYRQLGEAIAQNCRSGELIVFAGSAQSGVPQASYLGASHYTWPLPGKIILLDAPAGAAQFVNHDRVWLVCGHALESPEEWLPGFHLASQKEWPRIGRLIEMVRVK